MSSAYSLKICIFVQVTKQRRISTKEGQRCHFTPQQHQIHPFQAIWKWFTKGHQMTTGTSFSHETGPMQQLMSAQVEAEGRSIFTSSKWLEESYNNAYNKISCRHLQAMPSITAWNYKLCSAQNQNHCMKLQAVAAWNCIRPCRNHCMKSLRIITVPRQ